MSSPPTHGNSIAKVGPTGQREINGVLVTAVGTLHVNLGAVDINYGSRWSVKHDARVLSGAVGFWIVGGH